MILAKLCDLDTRAIDFVLAFPQADLEIPVYMEIPVGMTIGNDPDARKQYVLKLKKSLYGLKNASANWHQFLKKGLELRGFTESKADCCVFIKTDMIVLVYVDDCILISKGANLITNFITSLENGPEKYKFTDEGDMEHYLGVEITKSADGSSFTLSQPFLIG